MEVTSNSNIERDYHGKIENCQKYKDFWAKRMERN